MIHRLKRVLSRLKLPRIQLASFFAVILLGLVCLGSLLVTPREPGNATTPDPPVWVALNQADMTSPIAANDPYRMLIAPCKTDKEAHSETAIPTQVLAAQTKQARSAAYVPRQAIAPASPTNYGFRYTQDIYGNPLTNEPIIVLHETVGSASSALNLFRTPHPRDEDQVSYHSLIAADGTIIYVVPPDYRAFGAGNSAFRGSKGDEAVKTNPKFSSSVNNFAYHISLETPPDGANNNRGHRGYTTAQYKSLGWLVARTGVSDARITRHKVVDRSNSRSDPRTFNQQKFLKSLRSYPRVDAIGLKCAVLPQNLKPAQHRKPNANSGGNGVGQ